MLLEQYAKVVLDRESRAAFYHGAREVTNAVTQQADACLAALWLVFMQGTVFCDLLDCVYFCFAVWKQGGRSGFETGRPTGRCEWSQAAACFAILLLLRTRVLYQSCPVLNWHLPERNSELAPCISVKLFSCSWTRFSCAQILFSLVTVCVVLVP